MITTLNTLSTLQSSVANRRQIADLTERLGEAGKEASTSRLADPYRSLGNRSAEALALRARTERTEGFLRSNDSLARRLETSASTLTDIRESVQAVLDQALQAGDGNSHGTLQRAARAALDQVIGMANHGYAGAALFAGTASDRQALQPFDTVNPRSGVSPQAAVAAEIGAVPTSVAEAEAAADRLEQAFETQAQGGTLFEQSFYNGTPEGDARLSARIDEKETLDYGVQANDPGFRDVLRGLSMLAGLDGAEIGDAATTGAWIGRAVDALAGGNAALIEAEAGLGAQQARLETLRESQNTRVDLYRQQTNALEGVDPYQAATRLNELQTQLEASYMITARLSKLSFLNYV